MKNVGIVKWFNGEYGVINFSRLDSAANQVGRELFFYHAEILCDRTFIKEGAAVVFSTRYNSRKRTEEAASLDLLSNCTDRETVNICAQCEDPRIWGAVYPTHLSWMPAEEAVQLAESTLKNFQADVRSRIARRLPLPILALSVSLRDFLTPDERIRTLVKLTDDTALMPTWDAEMRKCLRQVDNSQIKEVSTLPKNDRLQCLLWNELESRVSTQTDDSLWQLLPDEQLLNRNLLDVAPLERQLMFYANALSCASGKDRHTYREKIKEVLGKVNQTKRFSLLSSLSPYVLKATNLFQLLPIVKMVDVVWSDLIDGQTEIWKSLPNAARVFCVYRAIKEGYKLHLPQPSQEQHAFVRAVLILYSVYLEGGDLQEAFIAAHECLEEYVMEEAWKSTKPLNLYPLLPKCVPGLVTYCEAQPWPTKASDKEPHRKPELLAWCPRGKAKCHPESTEQSLQHPEAYLRTAHQSTQYPLTTNKSQPQPYDQQSTDGDNSTFKKEPLRGARLFADTEQRWENWRLLELLNVLSIEPELEGLNDYNGRTTKSAVYSLKFAGWINRLNEIRDHLSCRCCGEIMVVDRRYAHFQARYNTTVAKCKVGPPHDSVYLNHCWSCRTIIDSRDNTIQVAETQIAETQGQEIKLYLCLCCGTGPRESSTYAQGDICPKCGEPKMKILRDGYKTRICRNADCGHKVTLPNKAQLTGPHCDDCGSVTFDTGGTERFCPTCYQCQSMEYDSDR